MPPAPQGKDKPAGIPPHLAKALDDFTHHSADDELVFPDGTLTSWERYKVHEHAHRLGLGHRTDDLGTKKVLKVWRLGKDAVARFGKSQGFRGVLSRGPDRDDNLRRTFLRYDADENGTLSVDEVTVMAEDLFELSIHELADENGWAPALVNEALSNLRTSGTGRRMVEQVTSALMSFGGQQSSSSSSSSSTSERRLGFKGFKSALEEQAGAILKSEAVQLYSRPAFWTLAPLCDVELNLRSLRSDGAVEARHEQRRRRRRAADFTLGPKLQSFFVGCVAGAASKTAASPLARVTILMQTEHVRSTGTAAAESAASQRGLIAFMRHMVARDGVGGLFRGNTADILRAAPYTGINFAAYEQVRSLLEPLDSTTTKAPAKFMSGGLAGIIGTLITYPMDLLRTQTAIKEGRAAETSLFAQARTVIRASGGAGFSGLWTGAGTAAAQKFPQMAILFGVCDSSRRWLRARGHDGVAAGVLSGTLGGMSASALTFPLSLIVRTLQVEGSLPAAQRQHAGPISVARAILRRSGVRGLYAGLTPELLKSVPACAVSYATYDSLRHWLELRRRSDERL